MAKRILTDSGYWIALFDNRDQHHEDALTVLSHIENYQLESVVPWPVLFEVFRTRFVRNPARVKEFRRFLVRSNVVVFEEKKYRDRALEQIFVFDRPNLSLVDCILREILWDTTTEIRFFVTFNRTDFEDVCQARQIQLIP